MFFTNDKTCQPSEMNSLKITAKPHLILVVSALHSSNCTLKLKVFVIDLKLFVVDLNALS
jgi:hypothetical protein